MEKKKNVLLLLTEPVERRRREDELVPSLGALLLEKRDRVDAVGGRKRGATAAEAKGGKHGLLEEEKEREGGKEREGEKDEARFFRSTERARQCESKKCKSKKC